MLRLFVGNIPHVSSDVELQEWVESQGFHVESAQVIRDRTTGHSRGFGFVEMASDEEAQRGEGGGAEHHGGEDRRERRVGNVRVLPGAGVAARFQPRPRGRRPKRA